MKRFLPDKATSITWALLWFMLPLSMRGTLLCLWLFGITVLIRVVKNGIHRPGRIQLIGAGLFVLFFIWQGISLIFDANHTLWWKALEKKSAFLVIPILLIGIDQKKLKLETWAIRGFFTGLLLSGLIMIVVAAYKSIVGAGFTPWSYHNFASPFSPGAIYASWYYSAALFYLVFRNQDSLIEKAKPYLLVFFVAILLLLASKLFIILTVPVILWQLLRQMKIRRNQLIVLAALSVIAVGVSIPFLLRLSELRNTDFKVLNQESFTYDTPFNGLTFRLLQWRFTGEILSDQKKWLTGVGINSNQSNLDQLYKEKGVYTGNSELGDTGYLGYNYHNQYLETLVATGIPGLLVLLLIIFYILFRRNRKQLFPLYAYLITVLFFLTESVLERQAGIIFFCLIVFTLSEKTEYLGSNIS